MTETRLTTFKCRECVKTVPPDKTMAEHSQIEVAMVETPGQPTAIIIKCLRHGEVIRFPVGIVMVPQPAQRTPGGIIKNGFGFRP